MSGPTRPEGDRVPQWYLHTQRPTFPTPGTIIDVGVGDGTPELYDAYPEIPRFLIEPLVEFEPACQRWTDEGRGDYVIAAASNTSGPGVIHVHRSVPNNSSLSPRDASRRGGDREPRSIDLVTVDNLVTERSLPTPFIFKVDTEGHDRQVLEGAAASLRECLFVVSECWFADRYSTNPSVNEVVPLLFDHGFSLIDVLEITFNRDGCCRWANLVFANDRHFTR